jgi:hypothetical protein
LNPWAEQWARVLRWYSLFEKTNAGREQDELTSEHYLDEVYAFFQNCFHLKDWLRQDPASASAVGDVESVINNSLNLGLCADLCHGSKHMKLTRKVRVSRDTRITHQDAQIGVHDYALGTGPEVPSTFAAQYQVEAAGKTYDAFDIAKGCVAEWETYLKAKGLL